MLFYNLLDPRNEWLMSSFIRFTEHKGVIWPLKNTKKYKKTGIEKTSSRKMGRIE
jgi:hypothetical protein